jgi:glutamine cyclotransferase
MPVGDGTSSGTALDDIRKRTTALQADHSVSFALVVSCLCFFGSLACLGSGVWYTAKAVDARTMSVFPGTAPVPKLCYSGSKSRWSKIRSTALKGRPAEATLGASSNFLPFTLSDGSGTIILRAFPHDTAAFTEGLFVDDVDQLLFESVGFRGSSRLAEVNLRSGRPGFEAKLQAKFFGEGAAGWGEWIVQLTWQKGTGFVWRRQYNIFGYFIGFALDFRFHFETTRNEGWGLTHDGECLIASDGSEFLHFWDPTSVRDGGMAREIRRIGVWEGPEGAPMSRRRPLKQLNELEYVCGEILANVWHKDFIVRINPATGRVVGKIDFTGLVEHSRESCLNGIAYDSSRGVALVTGKRWPTLFEILLPEGL